MITEEKIKFVFGEKIPSYKFQWENSCHATFNHLDEVLPIEDDYDFNDEFKIVGWCFAHEIGIRPKNEGIVVLFENKETFEETWFHFSDDLIDSLYLSKKLKETE